MDFKWLVLLSFVIYQKILRCFDLMFSHFYFNMFTTGYFDFKAGSSE